MKTIPELGESLTEDQLTFLKSFAKSCRKSIVEMVTNSQSGHPGGALSSIDYLVLLYTFILGQTGEKLVVSNGHISPGAYSVLGEMGYVDQQDAIDNFRKVTSKFEGHITRHVAGVEYGTGPLGVGVSIAASFAYAEKLKKTDRKSYGVMGDGECQEGQVHEVIHFARHHKLDNLILFVDYNRVQLTASLEDTQNIDVHKIFEAGHWHVINVDAHNFSDMWAALAEAQKQDRPVAIIGNSIMGKGIEHMEKDGLNFIPTWHGKAPKPEDIAADIENLTLTEDEKADIKEFRTTIKWTPKEAVFPAQLSKVEINTGTPILYTAEELTDCRGAYGKALLDLATNNPNILALTADLKGSVMTKFVSSDLPDQYVECGIAEQNMVSLAGGFSLDGFIPFASTFGAFMSSRAKDQARVNDINRTNVKMVATHCGLSVGEDGPTHQAIDDTGSFLGMFNTMVIEPADPNQTDRIIRYIASHYGNFYVRMGRHKFPILTKKDGTPFFDENYKYKYGACHVIREGSALTIAATGATITEALLAKEKLGDQIEVVAISSIKQFDNAILESIKKTGKLITVEDHNTLSGLGSQLAKHLAENGLHPEMKMLGVEEYQPSGKPLELYAKAGIDGKSIAEAAKKLL